MKNIRERVKKIFKPPETRETRAGGGIVDWEVKLTKDGLKFHVDQLLSLFSEILWGLLMEEEKPTKEDMLSSPHPMFASGATTGWNNAVKINNSKIRKLQKELK